MRFFLKALIVMAAPSAFATSGDNSIEVKQVFESRGRAVVQSSVQIEKGQEYVATSTEGQQCTVKALSSKGKLVTFDISSCPRGVIRAGMQLEPSLLTAADQPVKTGPMRRTPASADTGTSFQPALIDFSFLPSEHQAVVALGYTTTKATTAVSLSDSGLYSADRAINVASLALAYGYDDDLTFRLTASMAAGDTLNVAWGPASTTNGTTETRKMTGPFDPTIEIVYRLWAQAQEAPLSVDFGLQATPGVVPAKDATATVNGTEGAGGTKGRAYLMANREWRRFGAQAWAAYTYSDKLTHENAASGVKTEYTGGNSVDYGAGGMVKFWKRLGLTAGMAVINVDAVEGKTDGVATKTTNGAFSMSQMQIGARAELIPETLLLSVEYVTISVSDFKQQSGTTAYNVSQSQKRTSASLAYVF